MPATRPPANPPPGWLCPLKSRYSEKTTIVWNRIRVVTSRTTDRRSGASATVPASHCRRGARRPRRSRPAPPPPPRPPPPPALPPGHLDRIQPLHHAGAPAEEHQTGHTGGGDD